MTNLNLRFYIKEERWEQWDERSKSFYTVKSVGEPTLQYQDENGVWYDVPTYREILRAGESLEQN